MTISELLEGLTIKGTDGPLNTEIKGVSHDSRLVEKDFLFVAVRGFKVDGHNYINEAISRGAAAIVMESAVVEFKQHADLNRISFIGVPDSRKALALISSAFYGHPSKSLSLVGITGTNGKTTTSFITKNIIEAWGKRTGLIGTVSCMTGERTEAACNTTPESLELQRYLKEMVDNRMEYAVLEVSSHALSLDRVEGCSYRTAAFTNFTQDHLDFHGTMEEYFSAKRRIFDSLTEDGAAVLNMDDPKIRSLKGKIKGKIVTFGTGSEAMIRAENVEELMSGSRDGGHMVPSGLSFDVRTPEGGYSVETGLIGRFNVHNILASIGIAYALGISEDAVRQGVRTAEPVAGRFENVDEGQGFLGIVDYAHTEDALRKLIEEARFLTRGRVITLIGCGGDRDRSKRPLMGLAASDLSDIVILTSDNPRTEDPMEIIRDIVQGILKNNYVVQPDREQAIRDAVSTAHEGDTLLVAGKGHEDYQEINGKRYHFSDREVLKKAIRERLAEGGK